MIHYKHNGNVQTILRYSGLKKGRNLVEFRIEIGSFLFVTHCYIRVFSGYVYNSYVTFEQLSPYCATLGKLVLSRLKTVKGSKFMFILQ